MSTKIAPSLTLKDQYFRQLLFVPYSKMYIVLKENGAPLLSNLPTFDDYVHGYTSGQVFQALNILTNSFNMEIKDLYERIPPVFKVPSSIGVSWEDFKLKVMQTSAAKLTKTGKSRKSTSSGTVSLGLPSNIPGAILPSVIPQNNIMNMQSAQMAAITQKSLSNNVLLIYNNAKSSRGLFSIRS